MVKVFMIHGAYGNPNENWFPWLKEELESLGVEVFAPKFPTPENQTLENWTNIFEDHIKLVDKDSIFIGHSLGPAFILSLLEKLDFENPIMACFFVSGFLELLNNETFDKINKSFVDKEFNWDKIKKNCKKFFVFHSDNDPYVPLKSGKKISDGVGTEMILVKNAGHFNESSGYNKFELILKKIKEIL